MPVPTSPAKISVVPDVLRLARERAQLTPENASKELSKIAKRAGIEPPTPENLASWERGESRPSLSQTEVLAEAYLVPMVALLRPELQPEPIVDFRLSGAANGTPLSYATRRRLHTYDTFHTFVTRIAEALGLVDEVDIPGIRLDFSARRQDIEAAGRRIRNSLGVSGNEQLAAQDDETALSLWRSRVERNGVFVFAFPMPLDECRGSSRWEEGSVPSILLNSSDVISAQIFTLLHEYAHLCLADPAKRVVVCDPSQTGVPAEERLANQLAGAALLPEDLIRASIDFDVPSSLPYAQWPQELRQRLRQRLNVSNGVLGIRLENLGIVVSAGTTGFWRLPSPFARGRNRPRAQRYRQYLGQRAVDAAKVAIETDVMSPVEVSRLLNLKVSEVISAVGA